MTAVAPRRVADQVAKRLRHICGGVPLQPNLYVRCRPAQIEGAPQRGGAEPVDTTNPPRLLISQHPQLGGDRVLERPCGNGCEIGLNDELRYRSRKQLSQFSWHWLIWHAGELWRATTPRQVPPAPATTPHATSTAPAVGPSAVPASTAADARRRHRPADPGPALCRALASATSRRTVIRRPAAEGAYASWPRGWPPASADRAKKRSAASHASATSRQRVAASEPSHWS